MMCVAALFCFTSCFNDDDNKELVIDPLGYNYSGTITILDPNDGSKYIEDEVKVQVQFDEKEEKATLIVYNVKFAEAMPVRLDMTVDGLSYQNGSGYIILGGSNIIPYAMGGPFPLYTIKDFIGQLMPQEFVFSMTCGEYPVSYIGKAF